MSDNFIVFIVTLLGVWVQAVSGFGIGLIMMPPLTTALGLDVARPLVTLIGTVTQVIVLYRTRQSLTIKTVTLLGAMAIVGVVVGNALTEWRILSDAVLLTALAVLVIGYALYGLFAPRVPMLKTDRWGSAFGFTSGVLTGMYNTGGPPIVIYADARRWQPDEVRSNLQGFFLLKGFSLLVVHALSQNFTRDIAMHYLYALPAIGLGLVAGFALYKYIPRQRFRQLVLVFLLLTGLNILRSVYA